MRQTGKDSNEFEASAASAICAHVWRSAFSNHPLPCNLRAPVPHRLEQFEL